MEPFWTCPKNGSVHVRNATIESKYSSPHHLYHAKVAVNSVTESNPQKFNLVFHATNDTDNVSSVQIIGVYTHARVEAVSVYLEVLNTYQTASVKDNEMGHVCIPFPHAAPTRTERLFHFTSRFFDRSKTSPVRRLDSGLFGFLWSNASVIHGDRSQTPLSKAFTRSNVFGKLLQPIRTLKLTKKKKTKEKVENRRQSARRVERINRESKPDCTFAEKDS